jgi:sporulation protein YlmC with PRC-barrel domain
MQCKFLIGGLLVSAMLVPAFAQSDRPAAKNPPATVAQATSNRTDTVAPSAQGAMWRSSKLIGLDVYNEQNEKLGDVSEILLDKSGKVAGVVIGVGGFLGIGQRDIMVEMSKLKFVDEPANTSATKTTTTGTADRPATTRTTTERSGDRKWYPDHAVLMGAASKEQIKSMPEFTYN